jgi:pilus assembly protein CpaB
MKKKSNVLLLAGALAFVVGAGVVVATVGGSSDAVAADDVASEVLVAREPVPAGTTVDVALEQGLLTAQEMDLDDRAADAVSSVTGLAGRIVDDALAPGQQLTMSSLRPATLRAATIAIPAGKQGVAVELPFVPGGGGYVGAGDRVNVYGNMPHDDGRAVAELLLQNVEVLDVSTEVAPRVTGGEERASASVITYLLALDLNEAQRVIDAASNAQLWLALAG